MTSLSRFCPSCSTKRATLWAEFIREQVIRPVPHRHLVFALPKILRPSFRRRRRLLPKLTLCVWKALSAFLREDTGNDTLPAAIVSIQTAGKFLNWHPHLHVRAPAGAFRADGGFVHSIALDTGVLRGLFQANVLTLLRKERLISPERVERMREWRHSGFHAYAGTLPTAPPPTTEKSGHPPATGTTTTSSGSSVSPRTS